VIGRRALTNAIWIGLTLAVVAAPFAARAAEGGKAVCTVVLDAATGATLFRQGPCDRRVSPASTFKIPLALMGYDAGVLEDERHPSWDGRPESSKNPADTRSVDPTAWERDSVVWYSQALTRKLGLERFRDYVERLGYGNRDISGNPGKADGLTHSWLTSSLAISPDEQVQFLRRLLARDLPVSRRAQDMTAAILPHFTADDGGRFAGAWTVWGKTGSGWLRDASGAPDRKRPLGWFVGWAERAGGRVVFARLEIGDAPSDTPSGWAARDAFLAALPSVARP
jgi:beta-lactamase class D